MSHLGIIGKISTSDCKKKIRVGIGSASCRHWLSIRSAPKIIEPARKAWHGIGFDPPLLAADTSIGYIIHRICRLGGFQRLSRTLLHFVRVLSMSMWLYESLLYFTNRTRLLGKNLETTKIYVLGFLSKTHLSCPNIEGLQNLSDLTHFLFHKANVKGGNGRVWSNDEGTLSLRCRQQRMSYSGRVCHQR